ncbi:MAG: chromate transporter [Burkholderiales bacterium]|nr:chromate transporter [Burkholderiales bacterium]
MDPLSAAATLLSKLAVLSLVSIGGAHAVLPDVYRLVVTEHGWMTGTEFATAVALSQAAPGPNVLVMALVGQYVGGPALGVAALVAFCLPSSVLAYLAARADLRARGSRWLRAAKDGLAPITVGLVLASGFILTTGTVRSAATFAIAIASAFLATTTRINPVWFIAGGALVGALT